MLKICKGCGKEFEPKKGVTYQLYCSKECRKSNQPYYKPLKKRKVKNLGEDLAKINAKARAEGLSYGQYVAKYGYEK